MASKLHVEVTSKPIDPARWARFHDDPACGAELSFLGVVRNRNHGRSVLTVEYDAVPSLCESTLREIAREARERWGESVGVLVLHRTGTLRVGEPSVLISVATPHRDAAYQASRYVIEELKTRAPIWKKETYADGESEWLRGHALCGHSEALQ